MSQVAQVSVEEFHAQLKAQGAPSRDDLAFRCPMCRTVQSARSLIAAGVGEDFAAVEEFLSFSCVGRWTDAGPAPRDGDSKGRGCDWTLGGFFRLHRLEVITPDGEKHPCFEIATHEECLGLAALLQSEAADVG